MTKKNKSISIAQPLLIDYTYDLKLVKNRYKVICDQSDIIKTRLTSYPYIRFSVPTEAKLLIPESKKKPLLIYTKNDKKLVKESQLGSCLVISSLNAPIIENGWKSLLDEDNKQVIVDKEPVYYMDILASNMIIEFIPANAHIWSVFDLCTIDNL